MTGQRRKERSIAFHYLYALDRGDYAETLDQTVSEYNEAFQLTITNESYAYVLAAGCLAERDALDAVMVPFLDHWTIDRLGCCTRLILRMGIWELQQKEIASSIVINEAIELAKSFAEKDAYKFVNGVLDKAKLLYAATSEGV